MTSGGVCIELSGVGGADMLRAVEKPVPTPNSEEILVRVHAAGIAYADVKMRRGVYPGAPAFPFVPGYDFSGVIVAAGAAVKGHSVGDHVAGLSFVGAYAQYLAIKPDYVVRKPRSVGFIEASACVLNYLTALQMIDRVAESRAGSVALVHGGGGGVGTALLDVGRVRGIRTLATASSTKHPLVLRYGGQPIDYRSCDFVEAINKTVGGADVVFDHLGGSHLWRSRAALKPDGVLVGYGFADATKDGGAHVVRETFTAIAAMKVTPGPRARFYAILSSPFSYKRHIASDLQKIMAMLEAGQIEPHIGAVMLLSAASAAHALLEAGGSSGKLVLNCEQN